MGGGTKLRCGQVEVDTGRCVTKFRFSSSQKDKGEIYLDMKMFDLVAKAKHYKPYEKDTYERIFHVKNADGSVFSSYLKDELKTITLVTLLDMMDYPKGNVLKIISDIEKKKRYTILDDDKSDGGLSD